MPEIRSADNPRVRRALKLRDSARERAKSRLTVLDGVHLVKAYVERVGAPREIFVSRARREDSEISAAIAAAHVEPIVLNDALFAKLSSVATPTGILAIVDTPRPSMPHSPGPCVVLEDIQDPGNVGSILRSAAAASIGEVYMTRGCADAWSPRVLRSAMGAHFALQVFEDVDAAPFLSRYGGRVVAAAADGGACVFDTDLSGRLAMVFGNEGAGLTESVRRAAHASVAIPMSGKTESLNVAAAAAVCLFERVRQLSKCGG